MDRGLVIVAGMLAGDPGQGGATWATLQYALGFQHLGHDVVVVDPIERDGHDVRAYFDQVVRRFRLRAALVRPDGTTHGLAADDLAAATRRAWLLVNLSGRWRDADAFATIPVRLYVDMDPAFTQLWHEQGADVGLSHHTHHVTVGAELVGGTSALSSAGIAWQATLPPVVLHEWPIGTAGRERTLTTVANWRSYGSIEHGGRRYGQKAHSFRRLIGLPGRTEVSVAVALSIHDGDGADRQQLEESGWRLLDPVAAAGDPDRYRRFVRRSWAELGVAKAGYVDARTGWFSDRSACYLASGRPVILQDTGLASALPTGRGVLTFDDIDGAVAAIEDVAADYDGHRIAAREVAEQHLDSRCVLRRLLAMTGA
jgi:hypothetical protein